MKVFTKNTIIKKILIILITIIMINNFIMPNYVQAGESVGEKLVSGLCYLLASIGDTCISTMQKFMIGKSDIKESGQYSIKYSPGVIFSGKVPALAINFINPDPNPKEITVTDELGANIESGKFLQDNITIGMFGDEPIKTYTQWSKSIPDEVEEKYGFEMNESFWCNSTDSAGGTGMVNAQFRVYIQHLIHDEDWRREYFWIDNEKLYQLEFVDISGVNNEYRLYVCDLSGISTNSLVKTITKTSAATELQGEIATWYVALRTIALVGLLSVLVYIGIRIILSSTSAQDKAKYKNMLKDWVVAICILFVLHFIMAAMLTFTESLNDIIKSNVMAANDDGTNADKLMSSIRQEIGDDLNNAGDNAGYTIMYLVLVILTIVFTFQYLKRVIYIAFLTMIAPMIALTYPLDKIKDGKAQAFSFWLKEFILNCLIQPVHLLLYAILISNAIEFAEQNMLYAIVALTFLMPAEKVIKQMFGLKSESSYNTLGAAAGGAMVMNMLNKVKGAASKAGKGSSSGGSGGGSNANVRTATRNGGAGTTGSSSSASGSSSSGGRTGGSSSSGNSGGGTAGGVAGSSNNGRPFSVGNGIKGVIKGVNPIGTAGRWTAKAVGAAVGGSLGFAAAIADGDPSNIIQNTAIGLGAGGALGTAVANTPGNISHGINHLKENFKKGAMGEEAYNNAQFDKQFYESSGYKKILSSSALSSRYSESQIKQFTQGFLDNGITDAGIIQKALEADINGDEYKAVSDLGITDIKKYASIKKAKSSLGPSEIAARMQIAKNMPTEIYGDENLFVRYAKRFGIEENDAKTLFHQIDDFA